MSVAGELPQSLATNVMHFTGRTWLLEPIQSWLAGSDRMLLLTGDPGAGKSMVAAWLAGAGPVQLDDDACAQLEQLRQRVRAAYFCSVAAGNLAPRAAAETLAGQLTRNVTGFGDALVATLADRISLVANVQVGQAQAGASVTGINVGRIDLGSLGDEASFDRILREPLKKLYATGYGETILLIVDGLDEALVYGGTRLPDILARLGDLPAAVRLLVTSRPDPRVLSLFRDAPRMDLVDDAPPNVDDVRQYAFERMHVLMDDPRRGTLADTIAEAAGGYFLYAHLVLNDILARLPAIPMLSVAGLPAGLPGLYQDFLNRELGGSNLQRWFNSFRPVLGLIAVAEGGGLERGQIEQIAGIDPYEALITCQQYLDGVLPDGPFRLFHRSFSEFLLEDRANVSFHIDAVRSHRQIVDAYWPQQSGEQPWEQWDSYALSFLPAHLAGASRGRAPVERHRQVERLARLVLDPGFQAMRISHTRDEWRLRRDVSQALDVVAADADPRAPLLLVEIALGLQRLRDAQLQPQTVFDRARAGDLQGAERRMALFEIDPEWRQAIRLLLAWLAAEHDRDAARRVRDQVAKSLAGPELDLLVRRLDVELEGAPMPILAQLYPPDEQQVHEILERIGGSENVTGLEPLYFAAEGVLAAPDAAQAYIADLDSPPLVAFAAAGPPENTRFLRQYLTLHAGNNYVFYRNRSLWAILRAVLQHPVQRWVRDVAEELGTFALAGSRIEFRHALGLTVRGLLARAGLADERERLDVYRQKIVASAMDLQQVRGESDPWGHVMRRLSTLAEVYACVLEQPSEAGDLLNVATGLPYGFAGFRTTACAMLAGSIRAIQPPGGPAMIVQVLEMGLKAAHNIQDYAFCARATTRVNALQLRRWARSSAPIATIVQRFCADPRLPEFAAVHRVGEDYKLRDPGPHRLPIPDWSRGARTLTDFCQLYRCSPAEILHSNRDRSWTLDQPLDPGEEVSVPDGEWTGLLATELAADVIGAHVLSRAEQVALLQRLVPIAAGDDTALDVVLSRLLIAAAPGEPAIQQSLAPLVSLEDPADPQMKFAYNASLLSPT